jgi:UDP-N-acetyl-2-amino-2-deoxyglucuronate dehydrogenase
LVDISVLNSYLENNVIGIDKPVGFGIIGLNFGESRCPLVLQTPEARLVAVVSRTEARAKASGEAYGVDWYTDYRRLLERPDIEVIGLYTPSGAHTEIAAEIAAAGKHIVVTKPIEVDLARTDTLVAACQRAGVKLATEYVARYLPGNYALYRAIHDGKLGAMFLGEFSEKSYRPQAYYEPDGGWRGTWRYGGGGTLITQGIHSVDQMLWMMGDVASVTAHWGTFASQIESEDTIVALINFRSGAIGTVTSTTTFRNDKPAGRYGGGTVRRGEVNGGLGSATIIDGKITMVQLAGREEIEREVQPPATCVFQDFARWVRDGAYTSPTLVKGAGGRQALEVILAAYESARSGRTVTLPL